MSKAGRPRALDETKRREICALVSAGAGVGRAAQSLGCSHRTVCREAKRDPAFREQLDRAKATMQLAPLQAMRQAAQSDWRAAAWMLERSDPDQFGRSYRRAFGPKELRALARDFITIVKEEVDHPLLCDRIVERVKATINYAMRHAWDERRTGGSLNQAMTFFAKKDESRCSLDSFDFPWGSFGSLPANLPTEAGDIAAPTEPDFAKPEHSGSESDDEDSGNTGPMDRTAA